MGSAAHAAPLPPHAEQLCFTLDRRSDGGASSVHAGLVPCVAVFSEAAARRLRSCKQPKRGSAKAIPFAAVNLHRRFVARSRGYNMKIGFLRALFPGSSAHSLSCRSIAIPGWGGWASATRAQHALRIVIAAAPASIQALQASNLWVRNELGAAVRSLTLRGNADQDGEERERMQISVSSPFSQQSSFHSVGEAVTSTSSALTVAASQLRLPWQSRKEERGLDDGAAQAEGQLSAGEATVRKLLAGGLAGAVSKSCVAPLERLTTIMMADAPGQGLIKSVRHMWCDGGLAGLWSGNAATLAKIFPQTAIQFAAFHTLKEVVSAKYAGPGRELGNLEYMLIGSAAGLMACSATYPLDTMRTQMSVTGGLKGNLFSVGSQIVKSGGVGALYKGFGATLTSDVLGSGLGFMNYEIGTKLYRELNGGRSPSPVEKGIIGALAASATLTLIMPLEVVRRRLQVQGSCGRPVLYKGTFDAFLKIYRSGGISAFYDAAMSNYLKVAPSVGSVYILYDFFCSELGLTPKQPRTT